MDGGLVELQTKVKIFFTVRLISGIDGNFKNDVQYKISSKALYYSHGNDTLIIKKYFVFTNFHYLLISHFPMIMHWIEFYKENKMIKGCPIKVAKRSSIKITQFSFSLPRFIITYQAINWKHRDTRNKMSPLGVEGAGAQNSCLVTLASGYCKVWKHESYKSSPKWIGE